MSMGIRTRVANNPYNTNNVRALKRTVEELKQGEKLYINAIGLTDNAIEQLQWYVQTKVLLPEKSEVEKSYTDVESVMSGKVIFPQMTYIKQ